MELTQPAFWVAAWQIILINADHPHQYRSLRRQCRGGGVFKVAASYIRVRRRRPLRTSSQVVAEPQTAKP